MLEWYRTGADYNDLMADCRDLIGHVIGELNSNTGFQAIVSKSCLAKMELANPWQRLSVADAFAKYSPVSLPAAMADDLFDEMLVEHIEPQLGFNTPFFLFDYPAEYGSLARKKTKSPQVAERFELYINGLELANGFSELTDSLEQRQRFGEEIKNIEEKQNRSARIPERFLEDLGFIDTAAGIAFGLDRLLMLIMDVESIHDTLGFSPEDW